MLPFRYEDISTAECHGVLYALRALRNRASPKNDQGLTLLPSTPSPFATFPGSPETTTSGPLTTRFRYETRADRRSASGRTGMRNHVCQCRLRGDSQPWPAFTSQSGTKARTTFLIPRRKQKSVHHIATPLRETDQTTPDASSIPLPRVNTLSSMDQRRRALTVWLSVCGRCFPRRRNLAFCAPYSRDRHNCFTG